jgi:hypothetical protein
MSGVNKTLFFNDLIGFAQDFQQLSAMLVFVFQNVQRDLLPHWQRARQYETPKVAVIISFLANVSKQ